jgi:hypothetical protein
MSKFTSLLKFTQGQLPAAAQELAHERFPGTVFGSGLRLRRPFEPIPPQGRHFIIGVASYSPPELQLLDDLETSLHQPGSISNDFEVFDVLDCHEMSDFARFIPGIAEVYRTPVLGIIIDGTLVQQASGLEDVKSALRRFSVVAR